MWLGRRLMSVCGWLNRRSRRTQLLLGAAFLTSPCWVGCGAALAYDFYTHLVRYTPEDRAFIRRGRDGYSGGVPSVARRLKAEMETIPDPETAAQLHPDWAWVRFENGEWAFGHGINSHALAFAHGRGTLVLKDSRGRVRIFFGHVCGPNAGIDHTLSRLYRTLDSFDEGVVADFVRYGMLREWVPDQ